MGWTRLGQTGDLGRAEENGTGPSKGELGCVKEKKKASDLHKKNQQAEEFGLDSKEWFCFYFIFSGLRLLNMVWIKFKKTWKFTNFGISHHPRPGPPPHSEWQIGDLF
jgi:hypothetical protein